MNRRENISAAPRAPGPQLHAVSAAATEPGPSSSPSKQPEDVSNPLGVITFRALIAPLGRLKSALFSIALASAFVYAIELAVPIAFLVIIDSVIVNRAAATLDVIIVILALMVVLSGILASSSDRLLRAINHQLGSELAARFVRHLLSLPVGFFKGLRGVEIQTRMMELSRAHRLILRAAATCWVDVVFIGICAALGLYFSPLIGLIMLARLPLYIVGSLIAMSKLRNAMRTTQRSRRESGRLVFDAVDGIETIKSRHAEDHVGRSIEQRIGETAEGADTNFQTLVGRYTSTVDQLITGAILWIGGYQVIAGTLTAGQLMAAYMISRLMTRPIGGLSRLVYDFQLLKINIEEANRFLEQSPESDREQVIRPSQLEGRIQFDKVHFRYSDDGREVLRGVSFDIGQGEVVALIGPSGSGKSTILKLIQRLYLPAEGRIEIDGTGVDVLDPYWLREQVGYVPQDCWIMGQTIAENIRLGSPRISHQDIVEAARFACADEFISRLPRGYRTIVQGASSLSVGERQRIAIARAIVHRPKLLLFDESTSGLDHETEVKIVANLRRLSLGCTTVIVAHRLSALRHVSQVITLQDGQISECGRPKELIGTGGYFDRMVAEQSAMLRSFIGDNDQRIVAGDRLALATRERQTP